MAAQANNYATARFKDFCDNNGTGLMQPPDSETQSTSSDPDQIRNNNNILRSTSNSDEIFSGVTGTKCCCGKADCAFLEHNDAALGGLERDLETAARLGQVLVARHDTYVRESQAEQARLQGYVYQLESERSDLQGENDRIVAENRELLSKLENLNKDLGNSGERVKHLEEALEDCEHDIRRLHGLTRQTEALELRVQELECERETLSKQIVDGEDEVRSTLARWRNSERRVKELEHELQKIEWEARVDRERHEELIARMEKDRALERELGLSEGRLKATSAVQSIHNEGAMEKHVVSNFVRDVLTDNANLQAGIAELRELLQSSNDEVQNLREQILLHQPLAEADSPLPIRSVSLGDELDQSRSLPKQVQQEVHVHHHYHAKLGTRREKASPLRRNGKRKAVMPSSALYSNSSPSTPSTPVMRPHHVTSNSPVPQTIQPHTQRWSMQSTATTSTNLSSMASSPRSYFDRNTSIFDRIEHDEDSSRPTSPDSLHVASPLPWKRQNNAPRMGTFEEEIVEHEESISPLQQPGNGGHIGNDKPSLQQEHMTSAVQDFDLTPKPSMYQVAAKHKHDSISQHLEPEPPHDLESHREAQRAGETQAAPDLSPQAKPTPRPPAPISPKPQRQQFDPDLHAQNHPHHTVRRSTSHDSLVSISGMDIHIAQRPPTRSGNINSSLDLLRPQTNYFAAPPTLTTSRPIRPSTALATLSDFTATSRPDLQRHLASVRALSGFVPTPRTQHESPSRTLGGVLGGWTRRKWGNAPAQPPVKSLADLRGTSAQDLRHVTGPASSSPSTKAGTTTDTPLSNSSVSGIDTTQCSPPRAIPGQRVPSMSGQSTHSAGSGSSKSTSVPGSVTVDSASPSRAFGINQPGGIPGLAEFLASKRTPTVIEPRSVDWGGLQDSLSES